jgi:hypothetical protein
LLGLGMFGACDRAGLALTATRNLPRYWALPAGVVGQPVVVLGHCKHYRCCVEVMHRERQRAHFVCYITPMLAVVNATERHGGPPF